MYPTPKSVPEAINKYANFNEVSNNIFNLFAELLIRNLEKVHDKNCEGTVDGENQE